jgi:small subunit ribosomal protein S18
MARGRWGLETPCPGITYLSSPWFLAPSPSSLAPMSRFGHSPRSKTAKKRAKAKARGKKKDPLFVDGKRPRPVYVDYKDVELLKRLTNRQGKIIGRRKSGCTAVSQHVVTAAIKRARFMALLPYVGE